MKKTLTIEVWIAAAFRALTEGGPQAIRVEAIARDLNVSKGSFYWHFKDVGSLKIEMLHHWKDTATQSIIADTEQHMGSAENKLRLLVDITTSSADVPYGGVMVEAAIRDWARYYDNAAKVVKEIDSQRLAYLAKLFTDIQPDATSARANANILYGALIGLQILSHQGLSDPNLNMRSLLETLMRAQ